jgi:hypothetical protein
MTAQVSVIYLREVASGGAVEAQLLDAIEEAQLVDWRLHWRPVVVEKVRELQRARVPITEWPQSWHWNWLEKMADVTKLLAFRGFSVTCQGITQGLMRVDLNLLARVPSQRAKPLVYVEYLEAAPWNRPEFGVVPRYKGVGKVLITAAIELSLEEGFKGRVGLHSLPQADGFYRERCGMTDLGPDAEYQNLRYFEMTPEQAAGFLRGRRP